MTIPPLHTTSLLHPLHCGEILKYLFQKSWHRNRATRDVLELGETVGDKKLMNDDRLLAASFQLKD